MNLHVAVIEDAAAAAYARFMRTSSRCKGFQSSRVDRNWAGPLLGARRGG